MHNLSHARESLIRLCAAAALGSGWVQAQVVDPAPVPHAEVVRYDAAFFSRYRPNTALDMVRQLPGFQLDDGAANRGFAQVHVAYWTLALLLFGLTWRRRNAVAGWAGVAVGVYPIAWQLSGSFSPEVTTMPWIVFPQSAWLVAAAVLMLRDRQNAE